MMPDWPSSSSQAMLNQSLFGMDDSIGGSQDALRTLQASPVGEDMTHGHVSSLSLAAPGQLSPLHQPPPHTLPQAQVPPTFSPPFQMSSFRSAPSVSTTTYPYMSSGFYAPSPQALQPYPHTVPTASVALPSDGHLRSGSFTPRSAAYGTFQPTHSPTTPNMVPSSTSSDTSPFPPSVPPAHTVNALPGDLGNMHLQGYYHGSMSTQPTPPPQHRRSRSGRSVRPAAHAKSKSDSYSSWDGSTVVNGESSSHAKAERGGGLDGADGDDGLDGSPEDGDQPWGMPQDQYKALNSRDKKQVRNRIGAKKFRQKRKQHLEMLTGEMARLQDTMREWHREINSFRAAQRLPLLPPIHFPFEVNRSHGLGLVMMDADSPGHS